MRVDGDVKKPYHLFGDTGTEDRLPICDCLDSPDDLNLSSMDQKKAGKAATRFIQTVYRTRFRLPIAPAFINLATISARELTSSLT